eukprot:1142033-Pelagomonas_calceolata.AAC.7
MPRTQGNLIRFTSFGSTVNSLSRNVGVVVWNKNKWSVMKYLGLLNPPFCISSQLSCIDGQPASNNPPTQNQFSRAPIGIEGFPPLPKRKGKCADLGCAGLPGSSLNGKYCVQSMLHGSHAFAS